MFEAKSGFRGCAYVCVHVCVCFPHDGELPEEHLEQSVNLINFPQKSNQIITSGKSARNIRECSPSLSRSVGPGFVKSLFLRFSTGANGETQEELFAPSSNQCPIWDDLNVLNHGANVDGLC